MSIHDITPLSPDEVHAQAEVLERQVSEVFDGKPIPVVGEALCTLLARLCLFGAPNPEIAATIAAQHIVGLVHANLDARPVNNEGDAAQEPETRNGK